MRNRRFAVRDARTTLLEVLREEGSSPEGLDVTRAFELMIEFFTHWEALGVDTAHDGDALLYQWGTYDWQRVGSATFDVNLTRQFIVPESDVEHPDDALGEGIYQLGWTCGFEPTKETQELGAGNLWFFASASTSLPAAEILNSSVLALVRDLPVQHVTLEFNSV